MKKPGTFLLKRDDLALGLVMGLLAPLLVFVFLYFLRFSHLGFGEFLSYFVNQKQLVTFFGVWCLVGNIVLFTIYINTHRDRTAKGIFAVSLLYGIGVLLAKLVM